jgi:hypothetical protein
MPARPFVISLLCACLAACASPASHQPFERLDEQTGMTVSGLAEPLEFVENGLLSVNKHASFAYLGPVEWDRMGEISYGLWLHIAPGNDRQVAAIDAASAVSLVLDDGDLVLEAMPAPKLGKEAYAALVPWGQTVYFKATPAMLRRIAASGQLQIRCRGADGAIVEFKPDQKPTPVFATFVQARGITGD